MGCGNIVMAIESDISGTYYESCNCDTACSCVFLSAPTTGECTVLIAWHIDSGSFAQANLNGLKVDLAAHSPGTMTEREWKVAIYETTSNNWGDPRGVALSFSK